VMSSSQTYRQFEGDKGRTCPQGTYSTKGPRPSSASARHERPNYKRHEPAPQR
jgi:hypothetical protein